MENCFYIKVLITMFIKMCGIQYWESNNICNTWKIKEKLKILLTCHDLSFIKLRKKLETLLKNVSVPRTDEKKLHTLEFRVKGIGGKMRSKLLQKSFTGKATECSKHMRLFAIVEYVFWELNRCVFQMFLNYIKLVILNILFVLVLCNFTFYFKITWPITNKINSSNKIKITDRLSPPRAASAKTFLKCLPPFPLPPTPPSKLEGGGVHTLINSYHLLPGKNMTLLNVKFNQSCYINLTDFLKVRNFYFDLVLLKSYHRHKIATSENVSSEAQVKNVFILYKICVLFLTILLFFHIFSQSTI